MGRCGADHKPDPRADTATDISRRRSRSPTTATRWHRPVNMYSPRLIEIPKVASSPDHECSSLPGWCNVAPPYMYSPPKDHYENGNAAVRQERRHWPGAVKPHLTLHPTPGPMSKPSGRKRRLVHSLQRQPSGLHRKLVREAASYLRREHPQQTDAQPFAHSSPTTSNKPRPQG